MITDFKTAFCRITLVLVLQPIATLPHSRPKTPTSEHPKPRAGCHLCHALYSLHASRMQGVRIPNTTGHSGLSYVFFSTLTQAPTNGIEVLACEMYGINTSAEAPVIHKEILQPESYLSLLLFSHWTG